MAHENIEIEIKHPLLNTNEVKNFLTKHAELTSENIVQKDTYYAPDNNNYLKKDYPYEWLRIRESAKWSSINYKHFFPENVKVSEYCEEYESKLENGESVKRILEYLSVKPIVVVEKRRSTWMFEGVEIALDEVTDLWSYIELETTTHFPSAWDGKKFLYEIAEKIWAKMWEVDLRGYPYRILENQWYTFGE